jgi:hypothetical protein
MNRENRNGMRILCRADSKKGKGLFSFSMKPVCENVLSVMPLHPFKGANIDTNRSTIQAFRLKFPVVTGCGEDFLNLRIITS